MELQLICSVKIPKWFDSTVFEVFAISSNEFANGQQYFFTPEKNLRQLKISKNNVTQQNGESTELKSRNKSQMIIHFLCSTGINNPL